MNLSSEFIQECLDYNQHSGILTWKLRPRNHFETDKGWKISSAKFSGTEAGSCNGNGYLQVHISGRICLAHRLAWVLAFGRWPKNNIDHLNGDKSDNRLSNLREATNSENQRNKNLSKNCTSGAKGVSFCKATGKWMVTLKIDGKTRFLGRFILKSEAASVAISARNQHHGAFANHGTALA